MLNRTTPLPPPIKSPTCLTVSGSGITQKILALAQARSHALFLTGCQSATMNEDTDEDTPSNAPATLVEVVITFESPAAAAP